MLHPNRKIIGLCGHPGHGKSTAQSILEKHFGFEPVDDGLPIRKIAMERHGFSWEDVSTQEGKARSVFLESYGREITVREVLGLIGKEFEEHDVNHWVKLALHQHHNKPRICLGSVRREQGGPIREAGGIVIEIWNPRLPKSPFDFDHFNLGYITHHIVNDGDLDRFERVVREFAQEYLETSA